MRTGAGDRSEVLEPNEHLLQCFPVGQLRHAGMRGWVADGDAAVSELARLRRAGVSYFAVSWNCFWFFDEYPELRHFLTDNSTLVAHSDTAAVFSLSAGDA